VSRFNAAGNFDISQFPVFEYRHKGTLAYLGEYGAVSDFTQVKESTGPFALLSGQRFKGIVSWLIWRSAYLTKLGSWRNRLQVPVDWARTMLFGRDISNF
jgi:NADH:ubiquinone reductase (non-electrogenic)